MSPCASSCNNVHRPADQHYVQLTLQPENLFGGWELLRETGQVGGRSGGREQYLLQDEATAAFEGARRAHQARLLAQGFRAGRGSAQN